MRRVTHGAFFCSIIPLAQHHLILLYVGRCDPGKGFA